MKQKAKSNPKAKKEKEKEKNDGAAMRKDRRRESRLPYRTSISLMFSNKEFEGQETRDLSVTGAYVTGIVGPQKGEQCVIKLHLTGEASELVLKLKGEVVRVEEDGIAIEFIDVRRDCFYHLKNISYIIAVTPDDIICTNYKKPRSVSIKKLTNDLARLENGDEYEGEEEEEGGEGEEEGEEYDE